MSEPIKVEVKRRPRAMPPVVYDESLPRNVMEWHYKDGQIDRFRWDGKDWILER